MDNKRMGMRVRAFRKLKGYTQQELADSVGISLAVLGAVERGNRRLEDQILNKIADFLEITVEELAHPAP
ncbi:helix-turn-helix transcriptional regulator [Paenibacillus tritici]|uniref:Helix-turn-helix transcriptional regulator n=1 Tax=Paenibacillus tritici TaxID=1873425 RepID=A0ABX2E066_9BACL|nr:helix-turn-helix transcriptional regulator [Paenibacillus tritici]NQX49591.1 helix-turn-helix transcriptional regulator [Paenibacillus tritici]QUL55106.1 helix-turn-helix transcriptional regulator [Paenibacillus tritici]